MPYKIKGDEVIKKDGGKVVGHSKNPKKYLHTLEAVEHGWHPTHKKGEAMHEALSKSLKKAGHRDYEMEEESKKHR